MLLFVLPIGWIYISSRYTRMCGTATERDVDEDMDVARCVCVCVSESEEFHYFLNILRLFFY